MRSPEHPRADSNIRGDELIHGGLNLRGARSGVRPPSRTYRAGGSMPPPRRAVAVHNELLR
jgi:hypothetical protein